MLNEVNDEFSRWFYLNEALTYFPLHLTGSSVFNLTCFTNGVNACTDDGKIFLNSTNGTNSLDSTKSQWIDYITNDVSLNAQSIVGFYKALQTRIVQLRNIKMENEALSWLFFCECACVCVCLCGCACVCVSVSVEVHKRKLKQSFFFV